MLSYFSRLAHQSGQRHWTGPEGRRTSEGCSCRSAPVRPYHRSPKVKVIVIWNQWESGLTLNMIKIDIITEDMRVVWHRKKRHAYSFRSSVPSFQGILYLTRHGVIQQRRRRKSEGRRLTTIDCRCCCISLTWGIFRILFSFSVPTRGEM